MKREITRAMTLTTMALAGLLLFCAKAPAYERTGFGMNVLVGGASRPEYSKGGTVYIEAIRDQDYELRLTNPTPYRVAVALSVDGLNTIDAKHTDARRAAKWVIDPYDSIVISGWQVNDSAARRFYFTGERNSYGAFLGKTDDLGVIEAVFFQERHPVPAYQPEYNRPYGAAPEGSKDQAGAGAAQNESSAPRPSSASAAPERAEKQKALSDDYAATGMGDRTRHDVERVDLDLDPNPVAKVRIRYEFHPALVKLGIFPTHTSPLERREHARGFDGYCPQPN